MREARKRRRTTARRTKAEAPKRATLRLVEPEYRKMLVAVDGSSTSEAALAAAVALTRALSGRLRVLHVVDSPYDYPDVMYGRVPGDREELGEAWHKAGQEVLDWAVALARQGGCEPEPSLIEGNGAYTSQHIVEAARVWGADLIVVGRNGRRGLSRLLLGSVAEGVARAAPVPVLLVRATGTRSPIVHDDPTDRAAARGAAGLTRRTEDIRMEAETPLDAPVAKVMTRAVVLMLEGIPMSEARAIAVQYDYNGFPVVTQEGRLVGVLTKGDLLRVARAAFTDAAVWRDPVARWMAHGVLALRAGDSLRTAVEHMVDSGLRSLPVIDQDDRVIGMVSRNDLMTAIS